jgi:divalent metal cation (Fe/Co/Zn/Cd) transporter
LSKHIGNNKERHKNNSLPLEQRSDKVCVNLIKELFANEVDIVHGVISDLIDFSKVDVTLDEGLVFTFADAVDDVIVKDLKKEFEKSNVHHHFDKSKQKLIIYKA